MSKKMIIITGAAALLSFAGMFAVSMFLGRSGPPAAGTATSATQAAVSAQATQAGQEKVSAETQESDSQETTKGLTEKQLKGLVYEVREKIQDYEGKMKELEVREARVAMTQETLKKDIEEMNKLRVELAALVANLKEQKSKLLETRAEIAKSEKANLVTIAATYDKMDPASASKIISSMCAKQVESGKVEGGSVDDAVKILFYMTERTKAKLLAEMVTSEPKLAAALCQRLKKIVEQE